MNMVKRQTHSYFKHRIASLTYLWVACEEGVEEGLSKRETKGVCMYVYVCVCLCVYACVCVCEREREAKRMRGYALQHCLSYVGHLLMCQHEAHAQSGGARLEGQLLLLKAHSLRVRVQLIKHQENQQKYSESSHKQLRVST